MTSLFSAISTDLRGLGQPRASHLWHMRAERVRAFACRGLRVRDAEGRVRMLRVLRVWGGRAVRGTRSRSQALRVWARVRQRQEE